MAERPRRRRPGTRTGFRRGAWMGAGKLGAGGAGSARVALGAPREPPVPATCISPDDQNTNKTFYEDPFPHPHLKERSTALASYNLLKS